MYSVLEIISRENFKEEVGLLDMLRDVKGLSEMKINDKMLDFGYYDKNFFSCVLR